MKRSQKNFSDRVAKEKFQRNQFPVLSPMNDNQRLLMDSLKYDTIVVAQGTAGVGKTLIAIHHAAKKLHFGDIQKVVLIRAYQPLAGRSIGLLPGTQQEKLMPFYQQMIDYFEDFLGKATTEIHLKNGTIEICSLETIRGRSWSNAIVVCDESQNLFVPEIQALTTRIGKDCQMIFCGDGSGFQTDVKNGINGLKYLEEIINKYNIADTSFINFTRDDICRSDIVKDFVIAFEEEDIAETKGLPVIVKRMEIDKQFKKGK